jgi:hypothetical protein
MTTGRGQHDPRSGTDRHQHGNEDGEPAPEAPRDIGSQVHRI